MHVKKRLYSPEKAEDTSLLVNKLKINRMRDCVIFPQQE